MEPFCNITNNADWVMKTHTTPHIFTANGDVSALYFSIEIKSYTISDEKHNSIQIQITAHADCMEAGT